MIKLTLEATVGRSTVSLSHVGDGPADIDACMNELKTHFSKLLGADVGTGEVMDDANPGGSSLYVTDPPIIPETTSPVPQTAPPTTAPADKSAAGQIVPMYETHAPAPATPAPQQPMATPTPPAPQASVQTPVPPAAPAPLAAQPPADIGATQQVPAPLAPQADAVTPVPAPQGGAFSSVQVVRDDANSQQWEAACFTASEGKDPAAVHNICASLGAVGITSVATERLPDLYNALQGA